MATDNEAEHNSAVMHNIYKMYNEQKFTDVLFEFPFSDYSFTAHRLILAAASPYLKELFENVEPDCSTVNITTMDSDTFEQLVIFCYNGQPDITAGNAERMLRGAVLLGLDDVVDVCVEYMMNHIDDFLVRKLIALEAEVKCIKLEDPLLDYIAKNFKTVCPSGEIFDITVEQWKYIIKRVDINVVSQENLFWGIVRWYEHDKTRQQQLPEVLSALKLAEFDTDFILKQIKTLPGCEQLANEILRKRADMVTLLAVQNWGEDWTNYKEILRFTPAKEEWTKTVRVEIKRYIFSSAFLGDTFYFIGGRSVNGVVSEVQSYNLNTKELVWEPRMQERRNSVCAAVWDKYIYAIGGKDNKNNSLNSVERYTSGGKWEYVASMPTARDSAGVVTLNGEIYIIGGKSDYKVLTTVECYNPATNSWRTCSSMGEKRKDPAVVVHQGYIYAMGGNPRDLTTAERYDPRRNEWTKIASLNVARIYMCAASIGNQLWAFGGVVDASQWDDTNEVYDTPNDKWLIKQKLPLTGRFQSFAIPTNLAEKL